MTHCPNHWIPATGAGVAAVAWLPAPPVALADEVASPGAIGRGSATGGVAARLLLSLAPVALADEVAARAIDAAPRRRWRRRRCRRLAEGRWLLVPPVAPPTMKHCPNHWMWLRTARWRRRPRRRCRSRSRRRGRRACGRRSIARTVGCGSANGAGVAACDAADAGAAAIAAIAAGSAGRARAGRRRAGCRGRPACRGRITTRSTKLRKSPRHPA